MLASLLGLIMFITGIFLMALGVFFFITIILIPLAFVAGLIGLILLVGGALTISSHRYHHVEHQQVDYTRDTTYSVYPGGVKYCSRCGTPNAKSSAFCVNCGKEFLE